MPGPGSDVREQRAADVAVVVTAHNYGRFLGDCLDSLLTQTLRPRQLVLVDDGRHR